MGYVIRTAACAFALWICTLLLHPHVRIETTSTAKTIGALLLVAVIFGIVNAVLRPIVKTLGCALYALTLGLIALIVNGALFELTGWIARKVGLGFYVQGFWWAVLAAFIVSVISWALNNFVED